MPQERAIDPKAVQAAQKRMLPAPADREARRILDCLCDASRLKIMRALKATPLAASDLARVIGRSRSATSQHLRVLREVGAVIPERNGNIVRYRLGRGQAANVLVDVADAFDRVGDTAAD
jgi:DNA-binding transcriptional ArsR family regulator